MRFPAFVLVLFATSGHASPLFDSDAVIDVRLSGPIGSLIDNKSNSDEVAFVMTVDERAIPVQVRVRGNSRLSACQFPPLRLNFSSDDTNETIFSGQDKLKLVTQCNNKERDHDNVDNEYLAYRIFNVISESSYRTRMLKITYNDDDPGTGDAFEHHAFLIESDTELSRRISGDIVKTEGVLYSHLDDRQATLVYVFQYLIGNTDWSLVTAYSSEFCCHNGDLFDTRGKLVYVPYDFDLSGLVNASYAKPDPSFRIKSVRTRLYRGYCTSPDTLKTSLESIVKLEPEILALANTVPSASAKKHAARQRYLREFFDRAKGEARLLKTFARQCI